MKKVLIGKIKILYGYALPIIESSRSISPLIGKSILRQFPHKVITEGADIYDTILEGEYKITIERIK